MWSEVVVHMCGSDEEYVWMDSGGWYIYIYILYILYYIP